MSGQGELILVQRFRLPHVGEDVKHYTEYVHCVLARDTTCDEIKELLAYYCCGVEELMEKIGLDRMAKAGKIVRKR